ncbi:hypothetical protein CEXT_102551 [Caerostris extrusa]|uniref:Uncharacterized protein n=1 Tax=Caerostris extrusa TaxID=172846 RepID=A0AAV4TUE0_CAEEX|nr:hypothetical protein CEXT_102551 [Caerostris extrusa]
MLGNGVIAGNGMLGNGIIGGHGMEMESSLVTAGWVMESSLKRYAGQWTHWRTWNCCSTYGYWSRKSYFINYCENTKKNHSNYIVTPI